MGDHFEHAPLFEEMIEELLDVQLLSICLFHSCPVFLAALLQQPSYFCPLGLAVLAVIGASEANVVQEKTVFKRSHI